MGLKNTRKLGGNVTFKTTAIILFALILGVTILQAWTYSASIVSMLVFLGFQIFGILLPGLAIAIRIFTNGFDSIEMLGLGYIIGFCINIAEYLLLFSLGLKVLAIPLVVLAALASVFSIVRGRAGISAVSIDKKLLLIVMSVLVVWFAVAYITYVCRNIPVSIVENTYYPEDLYYWAGCAVSLAESFPPKLLIAAGYPLNYHYFSSMQVAFMHTVTGIEIESLAFCFYKIQPAFMLVLGSYAAFRRVCTSRIFVLLGMVAMLFTSGPEFLTVMTFSDHMMRRPFGIDIAMGLSLFLFVLLHIQNTLEKISYWHLALFLGGYFVFVGVKAPMAIAFLAFLGIVCLFWLVQKKYKQALCYGVPSLLLCALVYKLFVVGNSISTSSLLGSFSALGFMKQYGSTFMAVSNNIASLGFPGADILGGIVAFLWWIVSCSPVVFGLLFFICVVSLFCRHKLNLFQVAALGMTLLGAVLTQFFPLSGGSSLYFTLAAMPFALLAVLMFVRRMPNFITSEKFARALSVGMITILLPVGIYNYMFGGGLVTVSKDGLAMLGARSSGGSPSYTWVAENQDLWKRTDVEALEWVSQNTPEDTLVLSDRPNVDENPNFRYQYSYHMNRMVFVDGLAFFWNVSDAEILRRKELVIGVMNNDLEALQQVKAEGVEYIVWTKRASPNFKPEIMQLELVFDNETMGVFAI